MGDDSLAAHNVDAEAAVLGSILIDPTKVTDVRGVITHQDFFDDAHKHIFRAMEWLDKKNIVVDAVTVSDALTKVGLLETVGGNSYIMCLTNNVPTASRVMVYAKMVAEDSARRKITAVGEEIVRTSTNSTTLEEALASVRDKVAEVNNIGGQQNKYQVSSMLDYIDAAHERYKNWGKMQGLSTGFPSIDKLTLGLVGGELVIIAGQTSRGKQQRVSEIIPTPSGDKRFGDLVVGDYVFGLDGKPTMVTGIFHNGVMPIYRVWFSDNSYLDTGRDHLWTLRRKDRPDMIRTSEELMLKIPSNKYHIPTVGVIDYKDNTTPVDPYILGLYIADGSENVVDYAHPLDDRLSKYLIGSGLSGKKSAGKFIPAEWFTKNYDLRLSLIRGLMDGDGSYIRRGNQKHCTTMYHSTSEQLIDDITRLATSIGWIVRKGVVKHKRGNYFRLTFHSTNFTNPFLMSKEAELWEPLDKEVKRSVKKVEIVGEDEAMCIAVAAPDQLYVADTRFHIVTHNTLLAMSMANNVAKGGGRVLFVTLEMTKAELTSRYMFVNNGADTDDFSYVAANTIFQENDELDWKDIDGLIQNAKEQLDVNLVVIDHLHYFTRELQNVAEDLGRITKEFKKNAIRYNLPIILISHVRKLGKDEELSGESLRGSSLISQDADIVLMVNRDPETNAMGVLIDKNRNRGKLSDRTKDWVGRSERELNTVYLDFNNTMLQDRGDIGSIISDVFPGARS